MNKEIVWENESDKVMNITRRNVATLDAAFITGLDDFIKSHVRSKIDPIREEVTGIVIATFASEDEKDAVKLFCSGSTFFFEDLAQHLVEQVRN
jgi:hypothetical protein